MASINLYLMIIAVIINNNVVFGRNDTSVFSNYRTIINNFSCLMDGILEKSPLLDLVIETVQDDISYDFVIVGSGSAGAVIANRLSEIPQWKILLLEVGYPESPLNKIPAVATFLQFTDYYSWYSTEPQRNICQAMEHKRCHWVAAKSLGGSSSVNYMIYTRGNSLDYDRWAASGNPGWSYKEVLPYFLKSENCKLMQFESNYHKQGGYLSVEDSFTAPLTRTFHQAGQELGYKITDYNGAEQIGFSSIQANLNKGCRHSVASAFLGPVKNRKNIHILTGARVTNILINPSTKTAFGVEYVKRGRKHSVIVKKEVILSAGVFGSAQLLMLSGIGPQQHLIDKGIAPLQDLPVGQTLYDHLMYSGLVFDLNVTWEYIRGLLHLIKALKWKQWPTTSAGFDALAFVKTNTSKDEVNYPNIELMFLGAASIRSDFGLVFRRLAKLTDEFYYKSFLSLERWLSFSLIPILLHPKSSGRLLLKSNNPFDAPVLYNNYLTDPEGQDEKTLIAGIRFAIKLAETNAFKPFKARLNTKPLFGCETIPFNSDEYWRCALRKMASTIFHQTSTCKMGPPDDPSTVVNHELKVHGIQNLRVADASVIPFALSAHPNAPTIMIGEKTSDVIKKYWRML